MTRKEIIVVLLILIAMASRFLFIVDGESILPNFTAVGAIAIFGASLLKGFRKWMIPLVVLWISDLILNNVIYAAYYEHFQVFGSLWVYSSILLIGLIAYKLMQKASWTRLALTCTVAAVLFFLITNAGVWLSPSSPYAKDISGLMQSYTAGLPFFRNTLLGNLFFGFSLFGAYEYLAYKVTGIDSLLVPKQQTDIV